MLILGCLGLLGEEAYLCLTHYLDQVPCGGSGDNNIDENDEDDDDDNDSDDVDDDVDQETVTDFHRERMEEHPLPQVLFLSDPSPIIVYPCTDVMLLRLD